MITTETGGNSSANWSTTFQFKILGQSRLRCRRPVCLCWCTATYPSTCLWCRRTLYLYLSLSLQTNLTMCLCWGRTGRQLARSHPHPKSFNWYKSLLIKVGILIATADCSADNSDQFADCLLDRKTSHACTSLSLRSKWICQKKLELPFGIAAVLWWRGISNWWRFL